MIEMHHNGGIDQIHARVYNEPLHEKTYNLVKIFDL